MSSEREAWSFAVQGYEILVRLLKALLLLVCLAILFGCTTLGSASGSPKPFAPGELMAPVPAPIALTPKADGTVDPEDVLENVEANAEQCNGFRGQLLEWQRWARSIGAMP